MKLNARQWEAVEAVDRHVLVSAGAGTGKTRTVVGRVLYLLGMEVQGRRLPEDARLGMDAVAAITYTEAAAADLKKKLREALREAGSPGLAAQVDTSRIGTVHAFCLGVLREFALRMDRSPGSRVMDEAEGAALVAEAAKDTLLAALEAGDLEGLNELLAERSVGDVEGWTAELASDADRLAHLAAGHLGPRERTLVALAERTLAAVRRRLDDLGALDFDSMITLTRDLLRDQPAVRRALQRRVRCLVVDEFQDVDPVQKEIAYLLGEPAAGKPEGTRLMLVGDPKQSVFRFRRADVTVWRAVEREFREWSAQRRALVVSLEENYRSAQPILGLVEASLGAVLDSPLGGFALADFEVPYERITATEANRTVEPRVEMIAVAPDEGGRARRADTVRSLEAPAVARRARELVDAGTRPADIAILLTSWGAMETYREALHAVGLETYALRSEGFHERREVVDMLLALEAINDPNDDRALLGFLRSPFVGLRDETLLAVARAGRTPYWRGLAEPPGDGAGPRALPGGEPEQLARGLALLGRFVRLRDRAPADALLEELLLESGYLAHLRLLGEEMRRPEANVKKFLRVLRRFRATTVGEAIRAIRAQRASEETHEGDAPLPGGARNAITVTSVHSAKGLEWPVVFWCDLVRAGFGREGGELVISRNLLALKPRSEADPAHAAYKAAHDAEREELAAEHRRVWYVAATRARDRLILSGVPLGARGRSDVGASPGQAFIQQLDLRADIASGSVEYTDRDELAYEAGITVVGVPEGPVLVETAAPPAVAGVAALPAPLPGVAVPAGRRRHSATELMAFSRCPRRHWFKYVAGLREPDVDRGGSEFISAVKRGQIVHDVLERLREDDELDQLLEDAIGRWDREAPPPEGGRGAAYRTHLREEVKRVADHPQYRAIADLPTARRELAFTHLLPGGGGAAARGKAGGVPEAGSAAAAGSDAYTHGAMDLAALRLDGLVLLDVKTSQLSAADAKRRAASYAPQRDVYVAAAEAISGLDVSEFAIQFSRAGTQVAEALTPDGRKIIDTELREAVKAVEAGERSLTEHPAECRFCGYKTVGWCPGVSRGPQEA
ncbi:MAG TPA: ATP-dependent DNA helicase [Gemmatimonadales bacterium]|nr:ATP-dependent DNA helicase [Gemmatimonadales bacterium]